MAAVHSYRRVLLESFKYLQPQDLLVIARVNREWQHCSREDEVWAVHVLQPPEDDSLPLLEVCREQLRNPHFLAFIDGSRLVIGDLLRMKTRQLSLAAPFTPTNYGMWVSLPHQVLYCGGVVSGTFVADSYLINAISGAVNKLPNMKTRRAGAGLLYYARKVYIFGGDNDTPCPGHNFGDLTDCEKLTLGTNQWTKLQSMSCPRRGCTPVVWKDRVFIAGGGGADTGVEVFQLTSETFVQTGLFEALPCSDALSSLVVMGDLLVVLVRSTAIKVDLNSGKVQEQRYVGFQHWFSPGGTVSVKGVTYFGVYYGSPFFRLMEDLTVEEVQLSTND